MRYKQFLYYYYTINTYWKHSKNIQQCFVQLATFLGEHKKH